MSVPPVIVVALCGSTRKHEQSFDALKLAAKVLAASHPLPPIFCNNQLIGATNTTTTNNIHNNNSRGVSPTASPPRSPREATAQDILANVRFHFVHLSWSAKGGGDDDTDDGDDDQRLQLFAPPNVDGVAEDRREELLLDQEFSGATYVSSNSLSHHVSGGTEVDAADVDVLLHKTTTFGSLRATRAVARWVAAVQEERAAMHRPPLVVVDPLEKVEQLAERQRLYAMLDAPSRISEAASVAVVPRTFSWCRSGDSYGDHTAHDDDDDDDDVNGHHHAESSSPLLPSMSSTMKLVTTSGEEERCAAHITNNNNAATTSSSSSAPAPDAAESFWIIKPDESSGPRFTHHLVAWLATGGRGAAPLHVPPHVIASLPAEAERFIVQEFYAAALPVILKVYCVGGHTVVKPKLTLPLLARLAEHAERSEPFFFDSQDKNIFSSAPPPPPPPRPSSSSRVDDVDDDGSNKKRCGTHVDVMKCWLNFLADGSPAHQTMMACADELSSAVELTLYGFDVLLLPRHLARAHQRRRFPRGMGYDGAAMAMAEAVELTTWSSEGFSSAAGGWSAIFDETGNPTALLQGCVPVVVDVNYFPGYQGMPEASQHLLKYMVSKCSEAAMACE